MFFILKIVNLYLIPLYDSLLSVSYIVYQSNTTIQPSVKYPIQYQDKQYNIVYRLVLLYIYNLAINNKSDVNYKKKRKILH